MIDDWLVIADVSKTALENGSLKKLGKKLITMALN